MTSRRLLCVVISAVAIAWYLSGFFVSTLYGAARTSYSTTLAPASWIAAPNRGAHAWFRHEIVVPAWSHSATAWLDSPGTVTIYVDGLRISPSSPAFGADDNVDPAGRPLVRAVDLTDLMPPGTHEVAFEVLDKARAPAAIRAKVVLTGPGHVLAASTTAGAPSDWRVTSDLGAVATRKRVDNALYSQASAPTFSEVGFVDLAWSPPIAVTLPDHALAAIPSAVMQTPLGVQGLSAPGQDVRFTGTIDLGQARPGWIWLRVVTNSAYSVSVNNGVLLASNADRRRSVQRAADGAATPALDSFVSLVDIRPYLRAGRNSLAVHVHGAPAIFAYADVVAAAPGDGSGIIAPSSPGWAAFSPDGRRLPTFTEPLSAMSGLRDLVLRRAPSSAYVVPFAQGVAFRAILAAAILACAGFAAGAARFVARRSWLRSSILGLASMMPAAATLFALGQIGRWVEVLPPFPETRATALTLVGLLVAGVLATGVDAELARRRRVRLTRCEAAAASHSQSPQGATEPRRRGDRQTRWTTRKFVVTVGILAVAMSAVAGYNLGYETYWQDELYSIGAADGIRHHLLPAWPSGFLYFKSELYSAVLAGASSVFGDSAAHLRFISVLFFGATIALFGWGLMPRIAPASRTLQLAGTAVFALAPVEMLEARDVRMYQMVQFVALAFVLALLRALDQPSRGAIRLSAALLAAMYLTHEESFCLLLAVPLLMFSRLRLRWLRERRWLVPYSVVGCIILVQIALAKLTHPPAFGVDASGTPFVRWQPDPFYYVDYLERGGHSAKPLLIVCALALVGAINGAMRKDRTRNALSLFLFSGLFSLSFLLPAKEPRYLCIMMPFIFGLAAAGIADMWSYLRLLWLSFSSHSLGRAVAVLTSAVTLIGVVASTSAGVTDFGILAATATGYELPRQNIDFDNVASLIAARVQPGDLIIAAAPLNIPAYYLGRVPDYWMPYRRSERLLYIIERDGRAVDTEYGKPVLLDGDDLQSVVNQGHRIWLISEVPGYFNGLLPSERSIIQLDFQPVAESALAIVYLYQGVAR